MLHRIGTIRELDALRYSLPESVLAELERDIGILDSEYGADRDYWEIGGYTAVVETEEDIQNLREVVDYEQFPFEWVTRLEGEGDYLTALYLLNNEYSVLLVMPTSLAPVIFLDELGEG